VFIVIGNGSPVRVYKRRTREKGGEGGVKEEERGRRGGSAHPEMSDLPP
jgi:hypothetical protein